MRLKRSKFKAWLQSKTPEQVVGRPGSLCQCPIANFHTEVGGCEVVITDSSQGFRVDRGDGRRVAPEWAQQFILGVDEEKNPVTAGCALEILQTVAP
jgi:hypothetical protein